MVREDAESLIETLRFRRCEESRGRTDSAFYLCETLEDGYKTSHRGF